MALANLSRNALPKLARPAGIQLARFATVKGGRTQITTLPNGFTVASETNPSVKTATVGVWVNSGSRSETNKDNGSAHFLEHMAFKGTSARSQHDIELLIENMGAHLNAYTSREQTVYYAKAFEKDVPQAVEVLSDILQNSKLNETAIERERDVILREQEEVEKIMEEVVFDHLHATAFQNSPLGYTILGPRENILSITKADLEQYISRNYTADRMVLVGAGGVNHDDLVKLAEKHFGSVKTSSTPVALATRKDAPPRFWGSDLRVRNDDIPQAHIALAVEGVGWTHPDYFSMLTLQSLIGNWDRSLGAPNNVSSRLSQIVSKNNLANSFMSFNTSYHDTGLWGIYLNSDNITNLDDLVHFTLKEWARLSTSVTEAEVERAKQQLKASLLLNLDGTTAVAEDIGRQILTHGKRMEPAEVAAAVDAIDAAAVRKVAYERLWDQEVAAVGVGSIQGMPDYMRIRSGMSWMRA
ncbi:Mitochondrial-processing peptidase subunit beta [Coemansia sp. RSA 376]|nr:Mitochondrial-processing peptidase subunit beta [Coemansia sp. S680]KAJ2034596.1 Mitochondrial-processing peptidase subunit beta [Coemansia sp. S3946]KAJ2049443.1 Mitochondrial-processing peptidase subunit beta [Coemansia sp. S16]KAJ2111903.1 Mitochondrial-processing peptidase subunit beta [Coemansia sp. RSA 922]KAJ2251788.1 Mitochondrial-processing peptidase subunit beta [Coemansia sp. RSA 455]KAJ2260258.1 Mitochondrial-processing peptidase subunit beta [Coemansia sp. RSA 376]